MKITSRIIAISLLVLVVVFCIAKPRSAQAQIYTAYCCTSMGSCPLRYPIMSGSPCVCYGWAGPIYGSGCW
jgi:ABC-type phosphate transport system permease subunit